MTAHRTTTYRHRRRAATAAALAAAALLLAGCGGDGGSAAAADAPEACSVYAGSGDGGGDPAALTACSFVVRHYTGDDDAVCALRHPGSDAETDPDSCFHDGSRNAQDADESPIESPIVEVVPGETAALDGLPEGVGQEAARAFCIEGPDRRGTKVSVAPTTAERTEWLVYYDQSWDASGCS